MKKSGIYVIKNKINDLCYVGQSVDIQVRWYAHKQSAKNPKDLSHHVKIHQAMFNLGIDNFYYEILEECKYHELNEKEIFWIEKLNTYHQGYNMTLGGENRVGEANGRALLTEMEVVEIRSAYNNHIRFKEVYEHFKGKISKRGLQKVWHFETWKHILPEVYTEENRLWHKTQAKANVKGNLELGDNNKSRAASEEEIELMRKLRREGLSYDKISQLVNRSASIVQKYCKFQECKNPNKVHNSIMVKNKETGLVFNSLTEAAKWAKCSRDTISKHRDTQKTAGTVPTTEEPAHWISL